MNTSMKMNDVCCDPRFCPGLEDLKEEQTEIPRISVEIPILAI
jgi:hypothetical protein